MKKLVELLKDCNAKGFWSYGKDCKTGEQGGHEMTAEDIASYLEENEVACVVRCKDCESCSYNSSSGMYKCKTSRGTYQTVKPNDFCSRGERRQCE